MEQEVIAAETEVLATIRRELEAFAVEPDQVAPETTFESLGLDSLDLVELAVKVEDAFGIDIEEEDLKDVVTVRDAVQVVLRKLAARP